MKRKWGQHFLASQETVRRIVEAAGISPEDSVVEIGPGHGELTRHYIERVRRAVLFEIDPRLAALLVERWGKDQGRVSVRQEDIRDADFAGLGFDRPPVVLGNLPYYVSKPVVSRLIQWGGFNRAILMLQWEVVQRLLSGPGESAYSLMSVLFQLKARAELIVKVEPSAFRPPPKVCSAVIRMVPVDSGMEATPRFERLLRAAFHSRRQKLINSLGHQLDLSKSELMERLMALGISPEARPQEVTPSDYWRFFGALPRDVI
ncbi:MAG: ribosomal RNA small subunit methyltransferase A [Elusimicrobia bacterium]|nr:ribosomal RNA small subunit methyltransferase A [Elusimicrobiota bacterium]